MSSRSCTQDTNVIVSDSIISSTDGWSVRSVLCETQRSKRMKLIVCHTYARSKVSPREHLAHCINLIVLLSACHWIFYDPKHRMWLSNSWSWRTVRTLLSAFIAIKYCAVSIRHMYNTGLNYTPGSNRDSKVLQEIPSGGTLGPELANQIVVLGPKELFRLAKEKLFFCLFVVDHDLILSHWNAIWRSAYGACPNSTLT